MTMYSGNPLTCVIGHSLGHTPDTVTRRNGRLEGNCTYCGLPVWRSRVYYEQWRTDPHTIHENPY
jgi:hypothetical protein